MVKPLHGLVVSQSLSCLACRLQTTDTTKCFSFESDNFGTGTIVCEGESGACEIIVNNT